MYWKLWVDDQSDDPNTPWRHTPEGYIGAKSCDEAITLVKEMGCPPNAMDLDCDLGDGKDVKTFLKWLFENHPNNPPSWSIHSKNVIERENVAAFMDSWSRLLEIL
jgi:hypothetical protein